MSTPKAKPHLAAAFVCEKILEEKTGILSAIRIVDTYTVETKGLPSSTVPSIPITLLVAFKSGDAKGKYEVSVRLTSPSGKILTGKDQTVPIVPIVLEGDEKGANLIFVFNLPAAEYGLFWFDVLLEGEVVTRVPLRLLRQEPTDGVPKK